MIGSFVTLIGPRGLRDARRAFAAIGIDVRIVQSIDGRTVLGLE